MAFYAVDVRDGVIRRVTEEYGRVDNKRVFLIEAPSAKEAWAKVNPGAIGSADCGNCRHRRCHVCEECSVARQYSDYWICHSCGELNRRVPSCIESVPNELGKK
jgi:hypothetical protein